MKKIALALLAAFAISASAQTPTISTNSLGVPTLTLGKQIDTAIEALTTGTNWAVAPFMTYVHDDTSGKELYGGGLAGVYNISDLTAGMVRLDYLDQDFYMVGASLQLSLPFYSFNGNVKNTPFGFAGGAYKFGGDAVNSSVIGIVGAGYDIKFPKLSEHWSMAFDVEYWSDRPGAQWRFSPFVWKF